MGSVFLAIDSQLQRPVALKIPRFAASQQKMRARFIQEARAAAALRNPHICPVYDVDQREGTIYLTMAYIEGPTLAMLLPSTAGQVAPKVHPKLDINDLGQVARVMRKLAAALQKAHDEGVVHRDLKPGNIIIDGEGEPVVMDFGLAFRMTECDCRATDSGTLLGSPSYMSPEQVEGAIDKIGPPSDIYSLGVVFYEILTGRLPFEGTLLSVLRQIAGRDPLPVEALRGDADPQLAAICQRMMAKAVEDRYASMAEVAADLDRYLLSDSRARLAMADRAAKPASRNRVRAALVASAVAWIGLAAAGTAFVLQPAAAVSPIGAENAAVGLDVGDENVMGDLLDTTAGDSRDAAGFAESPDGKAARRPRRGHGADRGSQASPEHVKKCAVNSQHAQDRGPRGDV